MKVLIINPFGIGDVLFSTPLIRNIRVAYPDSYIGYICNARAKEVLRQNRDIQEIFVFEKDEYRTLWKQAKTSCIRRLVDFFLTIKRKRFDLAFDLQRSGVVVQKDGRTLPGKQNPLLVGKNEGDPFWISCEKPAHVMGKLFEEIPSEFQLEDHAAVQANRRLSHHP